MYCWIIFAFSHNSIFDLCTNIFNLFFVVKIYKPWKINWVINFFVSNFALFYLFVSKSRIYNKYDILSLYKNQRFNKAWYPSFCNCNIFIWNIHIRKKFEKYIFINRNVLNFCINIVVFLWARRCFMEWKIGTFF